MNDRYSMLVGAVPILESSSTDIPSILYDNGILHTGYWPIFWLKVAHNFLVNFSRLYAASFCWSISQLWRLTPRRMRRQNDTTGRYSRDCAITWLSTSVTGPFFAGVPLFVQHSVESADWTTPFSVMLSIHPLGQAFFDRAFASTTGANNATVPAVFAPTCSIAVQ